MSQLSSARLDALTREYGDVGMRLADPAVYDDRERQISLAKRHSELEPIVASIDAWREAEGELAAARELIAEGGGDPELAEMARDAEAAVTVAEEDLRAQLMPKDPDAGRPVLLEVRGAEGGEEANLFARELLDMYRTWAAAHGWRFEVISADASDLGGLTGALVRISGPDAWSRLKFEAGPHRVQRVPVTEAQGRVHTSSAVVTALVEADAVEVNLDPSELRVDTYRASGAGGQHVNKTESAVRLTHIPTGVAVVCQAGRSQHKNRAQAWDMLRARLYEIELKKREEKAAADQAAKTDIGWGHQIRSYVLQPYQMVKDLRTEVETSDTQGVLDGDLDQFMGAALAARVGATRDAEAEG